MRTCYLLKKLFKRLLWFVKYDAIYFFTVTGELPEH
jgi:hypothetical protein